VLPFAGKVLPLKGMQNSLRLTTVDVALTGVFCAVWGILNLILGPLSFQLLQLPILHDFAAFFPLLLTAWVTQRFGTSSLVGTIGAIIAILLGGPPLIVCFAASSILFDLLMTANKHRVQVTTRSLITIVIATLISAYAAGVLIGVLFTPGQTLQWALTFWGGWHLVGGILSLVITLPVIASLERANVRRIKPV
jgi:hypothetical protein